MSKIMVKNSYEKHNLTPVAISYVTLEETIALMTTCMRSSYNTA